MIENKVTLSDALLSLVPNAEFGILGDTYEGINWLDSNIEPLPSREEIESEIQRLQSQYDNLEYQRQRAPEYPDLKELADALYWNSKGDTTKLEEYYLKCETVKDKYPKPE